MTWNWQPEVFLHSKGIKYEAMQMARVDQRLLLYDQLPLEEGKCGGRRSEQEGSEQRTSGAHKGYGKERHLVSSIKRSCSVNSIGTATHSTRSNKESEK